MDYELLIEVERRQAPRGPWNARALAAIVAERVSLQGRDLSTHGVSVTASWSACPGQQLSVELELDGQRIFAWGEVAWSRPDPDGYAWGVRFFAINRRARERIEAYVRRSLSAGDQANPAPQGSAAVISVENASTPMQAEPAMDDGPAETPPLSGPDAIAELGEPSTLDLRGERRRWVEAVLETARRAGVRQAAQALGSAEHLSGPSTKGSRSPRRRADADMEVRALYQAALRDLQKPRA